jgi:DNA-binding transcriptional ArsR family regulator
MPCGGASQASAAISKHLKVLERTGLVAQGRDAQRRPRTLVAAPLKEVDRWLESYRRSWENQFASLNDYLTKLQRKGKSRGRRR